MGFPYRAGPDLTCIGRACQYILAGVVLAFGVACASAGAAKTGSGQPASVASIVASPRTSALTQRGVQTAAGALPLIAFTTTAGASAFLGVEIADTEEKQEYGLMNRSFMPDDQGMIFIFTRMVSTPFWMKDTLIPLSIAFVDSAGLIVDIQEMQAVSLDNHIPAKAYQFAIEANATWYDRHGVQVGDGVDVGAAVAASTVFGTGSAGPTPAP